MKRTNKLIAGFAVGIVIAIAATAAATTYLSNRYEPVASKTVKTKQYSNAQRPKAQYQQMAATSTQPACDDNNIVGTVAGGVGGGVVGNQFGSGNGKTAATIAGTLGGAYLGNQYIPTRNVTCR